jgi:DNA polymerase I
MVTASAPGKVILFGEHAVVYGEPSLAGAIDKRVIVEAEKIKGGVKISSDKSGDYRYVEKAVEYIRGLIERLKAGKIDMDKLVIWKTLTRRPEDYEAEQPHVSAARLMEKKGYRIEPGMKIGYVIVKGSGPLHRRSKPYFMADPSEIDVNYYVEKQVIPSALRILGYFGISEKRLRGAGRASLLDFMK